MVDNNGLTAEEIAEQARDNRFLASLEQADDSLVALRLLACELIEVRRFARTQNHNSTAMATDVAKLRGDTGERFRKIESRLTWLLSFNASILVLILLHMVGLQINPGNLLLELFKLIVTQTP